MGEVAGFIHAHSVRGVSPRAQRRIFHSAPLRKSAR
nr:MAG TPA: hypothetical protein [Caudoviricetes sp.]